MSQTVRALRARWWVIPLVAVLAVGAYLILPSTRAHSAPTNDNCSSIDTQPILSIGSYVTGDTSTAANDYNAVITPTRTSGESANGVPSAGPDVVYRVTITGDESAKITVKAAFEVSLYAVPENVTPTAPIQLGPDTCGKAFPG